MPDMHNQYRLVSLTILELNYVTKMRTSIYFNYLSFLDTEELQEVEPDSSEQSDVNIVVADFQVPYLYRDAFYQKTAWI